MSLIFGLHLQNNGVSSDTATDEIISRLLALQLADGGWALSGTKSDVDVTAMTIQALSPHSSLPAIDNAIAKALERLSAMQMDDGGFQSYGTPNPESAAQVWMALSALNIDALSDERFLKNGSSIYDAIRSFECGSGQFSHTIGGAANAMATVQVFLAITAYEIMHTEHRSFYLFSGALPDGSTETTAVSTSTLSVSTLTTTTLTALSQQLSQTDTTVAGVETTVSFANTTGTAQTQQPSGTSAFLTTTAATEQNPSAFSLRWVLTAVILMIAAVIALCVYKTGRRHRNHYILIALIAAVLVAAVHCIRIQSPEDYHSLDSTAADSDGTVAFSIRCDLLPDDHTHTHLPDDGWIAAPAEYAFSEGDTALTLLREVCREQNIQIEIDGNTDALAYVRGIDNLYELDYGALSGWVYRVNGASPSVGSGQYSLTDGDIVEWIYTLELGSDIP